MSDEPISQIIVIEDGAEAKAKPLRQNFNFLNNQITSLQSSLNNKETTSAKNAANGYCGLDSNGKLPQSVKGDAISATVSAIYPVGSIYLTTSTSGTCPIASLISGSTWVKVGSGRVLQGADNNHQPNTTIEAGLPNLSGWVQGAGDRGESSQTCDGVLFTRREHGISVSNDGKPDWTYNFDASNYNSIYGNSTTVQPPAYVVVIWRRTA